MKEQHFFVKNIKPSNKSPLKKVVEFLRECLKILSFPFKLHLTGSKPAFFTSFDLFVFLFEVVTALFNPLFDEVEEKTNFLQIFRFGPKLNFWTFGGTRGSRSSSKPNTNLKLRFMERHFLRWDELILLPEPSLSFESESGLVKYQGAWLKPKI